MRNSASQQDPYREPAGCIRAAREGVAQVMNSLNDPDRQVHLLSEATTQLESAAALLGSAERCGDAHLRFEVEQLRRDLQTVSLALAESDRLVSRWIRRIGTRGGYTEQGDSAPLILVKKLNVTG